MCERWSMRTMATGKWIVTIPLGSRSTSVGTLSYYFLILSLRGISFFVAVTGSRMRTIQLAHALLRSKTPIVKISQLSPEWRRKERIICLATIVNEIGPLPSFTRVSASTTIPYLEFYLLGTTDYVSTSRTSIAAFTSNQDPHVFSNGVDEYLPCSLYSFLVGG